LKYEDGQYYDGKIIGIRHKKLGEKETQALEFALEMSDGRQDSVMKFLSPNALPYTKERLVDLGCQPSDLTGADWLRKINAKLGGVEVRCKAKANDKGVRLEDLYLPKAGGVVIEGASSPFDGMSDANEPPPNQW